jgi:hypothetical protein
MLLDVLGEVSEETGLAALEEAVLAQASGGCVAC